MRAKQQQQQLRGRPLPPSAQQQHSVHSRPRQAQVAPSSAAKQLPSPAE